MREMAVYAGLLCFFSRFAFHFFNNIDQALNCLDRVIELALFARIEFHLYDTLDTLGTNTDRHADIKALHTVFALEQGGTGKNAFLVFQLSIGHLDRG